MYCITWHGIRTFLSSQEVLLCHCFGELRENLTQEQAATGRQAIFQNKESFTHRFIMEAEGEEYFKD